MLKPFQEVEDKEFEKEFWLEATLEDGLSMQGAQKYNRDVISYLHSRDERLLALIIKKIEGLERNDLVINIPKNKHPKRLSRVESYNKALTDVLTLFKS